MAKHNEMTRYAFISHMEAYMKKLLTDPLRADTDEFLKGYGIEGPIALKMLLKRVDPNDETSAVVIKSAKIKDNGADENGKRLPDSFTVKYKIPRKDYTKKMRNLYISLFESNIVEGCPITEDYDYERALSATPPIFKGTNENVVSQCKAGSTGDRFAKYVNGNDKNYTPHMFTDEDKMKKDILNSEDGYVYRKRGGIKMNEDEGICMDGVAGATNAESSGQYTTPLFGKPIKRKTVYITEEQEEAIRQYIQENDGATSTSTVGDYTVTAPMGGKVNKGSKDPFYAEANDHTNIMKKSWKSGINESRGLGSKKLHDIFKEYGRPKYGTHFDSSEGMDLHAVTDADVVGVFSADKVHGLSSKLLRDMAKKYGANVNTEDGINLIELAKRDENNHILYAMVINRNARFDSTSVNKEGGFKDFCKKQDEREKNRIGDGAKNYQWKDPDAEHLVLHNPFYKDWDKESKKNMMNKIKNTYKK